MAIVGALSGELDEGWFEAQYNTLEEAEAMFAIHKAKRAVTKMASTQGGV